MGWESGLPLGPDAGLAVAGATLDSALALWNERMDMLWDWMLDLLWVGQL